MKNLLQNGVQNLSNTANVKRCRRINIHWPYPSLSEQILTENILRGSNLLILRLCYCGWCWCWCWCCSWCGWWFSFKNFFENILRISTSTNLVRNCVISMMRILYKKRMQKKIKILNKKHNFDCVPPALKIYKSRYICHRIHNMKMKSILRKIYLNIGRDIYRRI